MVPRVLGLCNFSFVGSEVSFGAGKEPEVKGVKLLNFRTFQRPNDFALIMYGLKLVPTVPRPGN